LRSRKHGAARVKGVAKRFNGAVTLRSRKRLVARPLRHPDLRFNGAVTLRSRKHRLAQRGGPREAASMGP
jgi:hypothetical protein